MKYEQWTPVPRDDHAVNTLKQVGVTPLAALVLAGRGVTNKAEAVSFLNSGVELMHDPFLLKDMELAVSRITLALERNETIAVFGDYDVDGITSTCLLTAFLRSLGANVIPYIPDRLSEGYSLNTNAITRLRLKGVRLLITVDCGITNISEAAFARGIGVDVIITDHHECKEELPRAVAVVNPRRPDCPYPFKQLAGVGVALKLALAMTPEMQRERVLLEYADLAAVGTVADVMALTDENRSIVSLGLKLLTQPRRPGLQMLLRECGLEEKVLSSTNIGYTLAPRINASGRMGCPMVAAELILTEDPQRGAALAQSLCDLNRERQAIEQQIFTECIEILDSSPALAQDAIVLAGKEWHQGVVGIVASRLAERYNVPAFMICLDREKGKGSCRSYGEFNLFHALEECSEVLEGYGGHELAAGFTILEAQIDDFRGRMQRIAHQWRAEHPHISSLQIDAELDDARLLSLKNVSDLQYLEPFGAGNPQPIFSMRGCTVSAMSAIGKGRHTRLKISRDGCTLDAILFSVAPEDSGLQLGMRTDLVFYPQVNHFRGNRSVQLTITDWKPLPSLSQIDRSLYQRWKDGEHFSQQELQMLVPERQDFVTVWRYLSAHAAVDLYRESPIRLAKNIARAAGQHEAYSRTMICLEVMKERGLIHMINDTNQVQIRIRPVNGKVDLEASAIMLELRHMLEF